MKEFVDSQKLKGFIVGPDKRARTQLKMFGIKTGRTNQSTSRYPFNAAKPVSYTHLTLPTIYSV